MEKDSKQKKTEYDIKYAKENLKRVPLDLPKEMYSEVKAAADAAGQSVNGYIKQAITERMNGGK